MPTLARRLTAGRRVYTRRRFVRRRRSLFARPRYVRSGIGRTHMKDCLAVYHNPFSSATTNPKIPDGKSYISCGIRLQAVGEFVNNDSTSVMEFLIFPGLNNGLCSISCTGGTSNQLPYTNHATWSGSPLAQPDSGAIHKWRIVSQGCKFTLINNSDENDGWWEAIRMQVDQTQFDQNTTTGIVGNSSTTALPGVVAGQQLVEHPTYSTGKLRDIHKSLFHLNPQGADHEFNELPISNPLRSTLIDGENYDCILLRVYGRSGSSTPTRLMVHMVCNQEIIYQESSTMARYMNESRGHELMFKASKRARQENPANKFAAKRPKTTLVQYAAA